MGISANGRRGAGDWRWITLYCGLLQMMIGGALYTWGNYSGALKTQLFAANDTSAQQKMETLA